MLFAKPAVSRMRTSAAGSRTSFQTKSARVELVPVPVEIFSDDFVSGTFGCSCVVLHMRGAIWAVVGRMLGRARLSTVPIRGYPTAAFAAEGG